MRRWPARTWLAGATALLAALAALWLIGLWRFASSIPTEVGDPARQTDAIVVLTGRGATQKLIDLADTVTEMRCVKHGYQQGRKAQEGVEF